MISQGEVFAEANRVGVSERVIENDYVLSWVLVGIADSPLRREVAFKGGTALKKVYYADYRFSEDLDFTLVEDLPHSDLLEPLGEVLASLLGRVNLSLQLEAAELSAFQSTSLQISYVGPLGATGAGRRLKVDFTRGELLLDQPIESRLRSPYSDYPGYAYLPTYTKEEILSEKLCALVGRREPRDLYDAHWLLESGEVDCTFLADRFRRKCEHKKHDAARLPRVLRDQRATFEKLWQARLAHQVVNLPPFDQVLRAVRRHVRALQLD
jgi:predicted nucleotidyltransferase component of viral defense system